MAEDIHSEITIEAEIHVPKGFSEASTDQVPSKNASGVLEWVDTTGFSGPQGPAGPAGSLSNVDVADINDPSAELVLLGFSFGEFIIARELETGVADEQTSYSYNVSNTDPINSPYCVATLEGGDTRWVAVGGKYTTLETTTVKSGRFMTEDEQHVVALVDSTGILDGGLISINGDATKFDISAGEGHIVDAYTDSHVPIDSQIKWDAFTAVTDNFLLSTTITFIGLEKGTLDPVDGRYNGTIVQQSIPFTTEQLRDIISIGFNTHILNVDIEQATQNSFFIANPYNQLIDLAKAVGSVNISGNVYSPNGANLSLAKSVGTVFLGGISYGANKKDPNKRVSPTIPLVTFFANYQDGIGGFTIVVNQTSLDVSKYDDGSGTLATVASNRWSIFRVYQTQADQVIIHYGQAIYTSEALASAAIQTEVFNKNSQLGDTPLRGWIVAKGNATDLTDPTTAKFINAGKFGDSSSGGGGSSTATLQSAYNNSPEPEILTNTLNGALSIKRGSVADTDNVFEVKNGADTLTIELTGDGKFKSASIQLGGSTTITSILDEDDLISNSATALATQQSLKAYIDAATGGGSGDVVGPASATNTAIPVYDGVTGKLIKDSKVLIDVDGRVSPTGLGNSTHYGFEAGLLDDLSSNAITSFGNGAARNQVNNSLVAVGTNACRGVDGANRNASTSVVVGNNALPKGSAVTGTVVIGDTTASNATNTQNSVLLGRLICSNAVVINNVTATGTLALNVNTANDNTAYGKGAGNLNTTGTRGIFLGINVNAPTPTTNDWLNIGDTIEADMSTGKVLIDTINLVGTPTYADDAAAGVGGLVAGDVYKTATGELRIKL